MDDAARALLLAAERLDTLRPGERGRGSRDPHPRPGRDDRAARWASRARPCGTSPGPTASPSASSTRRRARELIRLRGRGAARGGAGAHDRLLPRAAAAPADVARRALITGIAGQDGSYLAELLLEKGYEVFGIVRGSPRRRTRTSRRVRDHVQLLQGDLLDQMTLLDAITTVRARRALQPGRHLVRARLVAPAGHDGAVHRRRRDLDARGGAHHQARPARLPGLHLGDLRRHHRVTPDRDHARSCPQPVRRGQALRPPDGGHLPRALRHARQLGDPLQPRVAAPAGRSS